MKLENIAVNYYDALPANLKKYWEPEYGMNTTISHYKRIEQDWIVNTNKMVSYTINTNSTFIKDEICNINFSNNLKGKGQVVSFSNTMIYLQHLSENYVSLNTGYIVGKESGSNVSFSLATTVVSNIPDEERIYWNPVTYLEYETEKNEYNKTVRVIDKVYKQKLSDNLKTTMNE